MNREIKDYYPLDNSGIIHLAAIRKWHTNTFRCSVTLTESVDPSLLQMALNKTAPRFPTIAAGITKDAFQYKVVPVRYAPKVISEQEILALMTMQEIENCAMRVLYSENQIAGEFFHSLTDGTGGGVFMTALLAEYLKLKHRITLSASTEIISLDDDPTNEELTDDYFTFSGEKKEPLNNKKVYQLPGKPKDGAKTQTTTRIFELEDLLGAAHCYNVSLTTFLTTVMAVSVSKIQQKHLQDVRKRKPIQIMVPVNLRKLFPSKSLRNFTLFALPRIEADESRLPFEKVLPIVQKQLRELTTKEKMAAAMTTHTKLEKAAIMKVIPLSLKCAVLRIAHHFFGEQSSCISLSNMGVVSFPKEIEQYVVQADFVLSPRISSPYNCGVVSYGKKCIINISRLCAEPELENYFFRILSNFVNSNERSI